MSKTFKCADCGTVTANDAKITCAECARHFCENCITYFMEDTEDMQTICVQCDVKNDGMEPD